MGKTTSSAQPFGNTEGLGLEFKTATDRLPKSFFETVCAFLNLDGGLIVLGVEDDGQVSGVDPKAVERLKVDIANLSNNPQKLARRICSFPTTRKSTASGSSRSKSLLVRRCTKPTAPFSSAVRMATTA